jgi:RNA polymerase sigma-54 factor
MVGIFHDRDIGMAFNQHEEGKSFESFVTKQPSLVEHLEFQLHLASRDIDDREIGHYLIGSIDSSGYLTVELEEVSRNMGVAEAKVREVLEMIQTFHPHGVGARSLPECLMIQLRHYGKESQPARIIVEEHLADMAKGKMHKIAAHLGISVQEVQAICDLIRTLDPRPGLQYSSNNEVKYILRMFLWKR